MDIMTRYGELHGVIGATYYCNGNLKECMLEDYSELKTEYGILVPNYSKSDVRAKFRNAVSFFESGSLKSVYLEEQIKIATSVCDIEAELITFYESGEAYRVFPLYGQVSGYWSEQEEYELAKEYPIDLEFLKGNYKVECFCFYQSGKVKSLTFWNKEIIPVQSHVGEIQTKIGVCFYESGKLKSVEPYKLTKVMTPIGEIASFNPSPIGITGDINSLQFSEEGDVMNIMTSTNQIIARNDKEEILLHPKLKPSDMDPESLELVPLQIQFEEEKIKISIGKTERYELPKSEYSFVVKSHTFSS